MADRVPSDHPSIETIRATVERSGATSRPEVRLATADGLPDGEVVRLVIDDRESHAVLDRRFDGTPVIRGAYDSPRLARERSGTDRLARWIDRAGLGFGRSVLVDVVVPGFRYGLRRPGSSAVYDTSTPPAPGLRRIAEGLDADDGDGS